MHALGFTPTTWALVFLLASLQTLNHSKQVANSTKGHSHSANVDQTSRAIWLGTYQQKLPKEILEKAGHLLVLVLDVKGTPPKTTESIRHWTPAKTY